MEAITTTEKAYAKINYQLYVGAKREDGFHEISTLMQTISLADDITISITEGTGIVLHIMGNTAVPCDSRNLAWRAAERYMEYIHETHHVEIQIVKRIPMAGGLAGGSADCAATLCALNRLFGNRLTQGELLKLAAQLGSDIPFCMVGGLAWCTGRGEIVNPLARIPGARHFLIVNRGEAVSTGEAFTWLDAREVSDIPADTWKNCLTALGENISEIDQYLHNDFEPFVLPICPLAKEAKEDMIAVGAIAALMSGSGSTVYGVFESRDAALRAQEQLPYVSHYATDVCEERI